MARIKTSSIQFDMMVTFMEQHGDLSKPTSNARGRLGTLRQWEELTLILNSDGGGEAKTSDKWRKVWSDYKNNTKKKAARLHKSISGTGGGPALNLKLTDLEQRVLGIIGEQAASGLPVAEVGLMQQEISISNQQAPPPHSPPPPLSPPHAEDYFDSWDIPGPSMHVPTAHRPQIDNLNIDSPIIEISGALLQEREATTPCQFVVPGIEPNHIQTPTTVSPSVHAALPADSGQTPRRRSRQRRNRASPRRRPIRQTHTEQAAQQFLHSDQEWRNMQISQHRDRMDLRSECNRIRQMEVEAQRQWQEIGMRALDILEKLVNKFCRE